MHIALVSFRSSFPSLFGISEQIFEILMKHIEHSSHVASSY